ncbi:YobA family protein [Pontibacter ruber]|uniref:YobA family protein n=1 Tax=Pontibacter ruber TaxID=1343895 RepID=A0ABW5CXU7_9BACT|nr:YobA family protein [Pontibacter ruber]
MKKYAGLLYLFVALLFSCQRETPKRMPDTLPDIRGNITNLKKTTTKKGENSVAVVMVQSVEGNDIQIPRASIRIDQHTLIENQSGGTVKLEHLREGQQVEAWFSGPTKESDPVQAQALAIRVNE